jgi:hypothetical protein
MTEREGPPGPEIPESRPEKRIHIIDGHIQRAYESILESSCEMGLIEDRGILLFVLDGERYKNSHKRLNASTLPFPRNKSGGYLFLEHLGGRNVIAVGWQEGKLNFRIEISGKEFGDGPKLSVSRMPDYFKDCFPHQEYVEGMKRLQYHNGRMDLTEFEEARYPCLVRDGGGFILAGITGARGKPSSPSYPTVEQFLATEEWQEVEAIKASFRQAAERRRNQTPKGHMHYPHHIPHPHIALHGHQGAH